MEEEWIKWLRENRPDLYEQMKKSVWWQAEWRDNNIAALEQRVKELEAERVSDGLAGQAALDEANNRVQELEVKLQREIGLCNDAYKRAGLRWKQYDAEKQDHKITKRELSTLRAEQPKCFICGTLLDSYSKCAACYDAKGAECDSLREIAYPDGPEKDAAVPMVTYETVYDEVHKLRAENERLRERIKYLEENW